MKKIIKILISVLVVIFIAYISFRLGNIATISSGEKITVLAAEYEQLKVNNLAYEQLDALKDLIYENFLFEVNEQQLNEGMYKGLFAGLNDPYSYYMTAEEFKSLEETTSGTFGGIGIVVSASEDNYIEIVAPLENSPGDRAGLKTGDIITGVNGEFFLGSQLDEAVAIMRGEPGTEVTLTIIRTNADQTVTTFDVTLIREIITIETVKGTMMENGIGYLKISSFDLNTNSEYLQEINALINAGAKGIVLDLRNNPGGLVDSTVAVANSLLPEGVIVKTVDKHGNEEIENSDANQIDIPLVVLINEGSASASEILAGALKDYGRATIVGTTSFGKGIVQRLIPLGTDKDSPGVKLTVSEYYTPKGTKIHGIGVIPDVQVLLSEDVSVIGPDNLVGDTQLQKAIELLTSPVSQ